MKVVKQRRDGVVQRYSSSVPKFTIVFDDGKPSDKTVSGFPALKKELRAFYVRNKDNDYQYDVQVFDARGVDVSETQVVQEMIEEIIDEVGS